MKYSGSIDDCLPINVIQGDVEEVQENHQSLDILEEALVSNDSRYGSFLGCTTKHN